MEEIPKDVILYHIIPFLSFMEIKNLSNACKHFSLMIPKIFEIGKYLYKNFFEYLSILAKNLTVISCEKHSNNTFLTSAVIYFREINISNEIQFDKFWKKRLRQRGTWRNVFTFKSEAEKFHFIYQIVVNLEKYYAIFNENHEFNINDRIIRSCNLFNIIDQKNFSSRIVFKYQDFESLILKDLPKDFVFFFKLIGFEKFFSFFKEKLLNFLQ